MMMWFCLLVLRVALLFGLGAPRGAWWAKLLCAFFLVATWHDKGWREL